MYEFLDSDEEIFTLKGIGGAGKTTILKHVLQDKNNIVAATVSHVAKSVLEEVIGDFAICMTIAKLLNMKQYIDEDGAIRFMPKLFFNEDQKLPIENADIIVIDECSMIDETIHNFIMRYKKSKAKIIYLGDPFQLPPVVENGDSDQDSISFKFTKAELLKSVRYGGLISDIGQAIRDEITIINSGKAGSKYLFNELATKQGFRHRTSRVDGNGHGVIYLNNIEDVIRITKHHHSKSNDINELRSIAYRRKTIDIINKEMRLHLYQEQLGNIPYEEFPQFIHNEVIISSSSYKNGLIHNNECFKVDSYTETTGPYGIPCLSMKLKPNPITDSSTQRILVLDEKKGLKQYNEVLLGLKKAAELDKRQWANYHRFKDEFCNFEYAISLNSHRSQGSTYKNVIVFEDDILSVTKNRVKNKLQSLYVSCTRAKKRIYIYNKKYTVSQHLLPEELKNELGL